jgi:hypothetical protein
MRPLSKVCDPSSSYFKSFGSENLSGSRSEVSVTPMLLLSAAALRPSIIVAIGMKDSAVKWCLATSPEPHLWNIGVGGAVADGEAGENDRVSHKFQPSARFSAANSLYAFTLM